MNPQGITPQVCSGNVTLTVPGSTAAPLVIPVTFNVSSSALLNVSQGAINLTVLAGSAATMQTISVTSTNNTALSFSATEATNPAGLSWLAVTPNAGNTPNNLQVTINPANLGVGIYTGSIVVSSSAVECSVRDDSGYAQRGCVHRRGGADEPDFHTSRRRHARRRANRSRSPECPAGATIGVISTVLSGTGWLTATASGSTVTVTANGSQLAQGTYSGVVTVIVPGAAASPLYVPVTLNVTSATSAIAISANAASFNVLAGSKSVPLTQRSR